MNISKRFVGLTDDEHYNVVKDLKEDKIYDDADEIADLLNSLEFRLDVCENHKLFSRRELERENEQLKQMNNALERRLKICEYGDFKYE